MKKEILEKIKKKLSERKEQIGKQLRQITSGRKAKSINIDADLSFPQYGDKEDENAAEVASYSDTVSLEHTLKKVLRDINGALKRIEKGGYGICKYCNEEINEKRLLARPDSSACMACKTRISKQ